MTQEEKARAYDEALERAKKVHDEHRAQPFDVMLKVFPELKESEDERIRKEIISALKYANHKGVYDKHLAWLENQRERKTLRWMIDFLDSYRKKIGCSLDYYEARDVDGKVLCFEEWLEKQGTEMKDVISMDVNSETEWDDIHKFLRMNLDGEKVKLLIIREE